jgi:hypothetical protein
MDTCTDLRGVCVIVNLLNVNDPPFFNESLPQPVLSINEQTAINTTVKNGDFKTGGAVVDLDDASGDTLVFSIECLSCPLVKIATVMRTTNGKVISYAHGLSTGDVIKVSNVIGMPELSGSYKYYTITNGGVNQFYLNVDTTNFASGNVGTGGSGTHMYVRMFHDGVLRSTLVIQSNLIGSISVRVSVRDQGEGDPVSKFFVIDVIDLNDAPTLPLQTIKISEDWNPATLGTFSASSLVKHTGSFVASSNLQGFQAFDLDGIYYPANDPDGNTPTGKALNFFYNHYESATTNLKNWAVINLQSPSQQRATLRPDFKLDYETQTVWNVTVIAVDGQKANNTGIIRVEVIDVNEPPTIQNITDEVSENTPTRYIT